MLTTVRRTWLTYATLAAAPLLAVGLTACGGDESKPAASTASTPAASSAESSSGNPAASGDAQFQWELKFTKCLRAEGIKVGDPDPVKGAPDVVHDAAYSRAFKLCVGKIGDPPTVIANRGKQKQQLESSLKTAKCLRGKGFKVADPTPEMALSIPEQVSTTVLNECLAAGGQP
jgi:hypothetical protein